MFRNGSFAKRPRVAHMFNHGWWRLAVGGWRLATGDWRLVAVGGGWRRLVVGDWWMVAVGSGWRLVAAGVSRLAVGGGWRLEVGGPWGRSFATDKSGSLKTALRFAAPLLQCITARTPSEQGTAPHARHSPTDLAGWRRRRPRGPS